MLGANARVLATVERTTALSPRVRGVRLQVPVEYTWRAGQHVAVWPLAEGEDARPRYYSLASPPSGAGGLELCVGESEDAPELERGGQVWLSLPAGQPAVPEPVASLALIGVGTGVALLRAVLLEQGALAAPPRIALLVGFRFEEDVLYAAEFEERVRAGVLDYRPVLSQPSPSWRGLSGRVQAHVKDLAPAERYCVCGKLGLVEDVRGMLLGSGVPENRIFAEGY